MIADRAALLLLRLSRLGANPLVRAVPALLIAGMALLALHFLSRHVHWAEVRADLATAPLSSLALAVLAMLVSFAALSLYDVLAVNSLAPGRVPWRIAALAGASGYAISNLLGASWLTGTAVRYRIYAATGLDLRLVVGVIATSWSAFWMAALLILGGLMVFHPEGLSGVLPIGAGAETGAGLALLCGLAVAFGWLARGPRQLRLSGEAYALPGPCLAAALMAVAVLDISGAALTLYVLLPADAVPNITVYFAVFVGAVTLGILSHSPGGLGVFEATIIAGLGAGGRSDVLAALLLYRLVYSLLPFLLAALGLGLVWVIQQRRSVMKAASWAYAVANPAVPMIAAGAALLSGLILLLSGNLPSDPARVGALRGVLPLAFVELSHLAASIAGLLLVVVARGLNRRLARAWGAAMVLLCVGLVASLARGLEWKEALSLALSMLVLGLFRGAFYRLRGDSAFRLNAAWMVSVLGLLATAFWVGLFAYKHVEYRDALWWDFAWDGDASRFLRASLAVAVVGMAVAFNSVVMPRARRQPSGPVPQAVIDLLACCPDAEPQIALSGDKAFLLAPDNRAFLAYADTGRTFVTKGDPVGEPEAARQLIWTLREMADKAGRRCAFYGVTARNLPTYLDLGLTILKIGEVARVDLTGFTLEGSAKRDFRQAVAKARREGYVFEILRKADVPAAFAALKAVSDAWLAAKNGSEKGFSLGACTPDYLAWFDHAVLRQVASGRIVAFANLMQGAGNAESVHRPDAL
ncbi:Phosphatidylglycerol lysyltransferase [Frigidibacter albus]